MGVVGHTEMCCFICWVLRFWLFTFSSGFPFSGRGTERTPDENGRQRKEESSSLELVAKRLSAARSLHLISSNGVLHCGTIGILHTLLF